MLDLWSGEPLRVNMAEAGGICPYLDVPHPQTCDLLRLLRRHRIACEVHYAYGGATGAADLDRALDRFTFPRNPGSQIQGLLDQVHGYLEP